MGREVTLSYTRDAAFLNQVANHPDVRPWLGTDGASHVDVGVLLALPGAFALTNEHGGFVFTPVDGGGYEFHTLFMPAGRGRAAREASLQAIDLMFGFYEASSLQTYVPHGNRAARGLVRLVGFKPYAEDDESTYWRMDKEGWKARALSHAA